MARRKNQPELVRAKCDLAERLRAIRTELFGERGGPEVARRLGIPIRTWYNYEAGVTVPAEVMLRFVELTGAEPGWLLTGQGPRFRSRPTSAGPEDGSVEGLLRAALRRLEDGSRPNRRPARFVLSVAPTADCGEVPPVPVEDPDEGGGAAPGPDDPWHEVARREWGEALSQGRCVRIEGDAMAPIVADGASVVFAEEPEDPDDLEGKLVVAWVEGKPLVRWFGRSGRFALLRAENPAAEPGTVLISLDAPPEQRKIHRVLWVSTPH